MFEMPSMPYKARCPNCFHETLVDADKVTLLPVNISNLVSFFLNLPDFSETTMKLVKHEGRLRLEVDRLNEKIVL